jgi:hypothetical protein
MCQAHFSRTVLIIIQNGDKEVAEETLREGFEDQAKMTELAVELRQKKQSHWGISE